MFNIPEEFEFSPKRLVFRKGAPSSGRERFQPGAEEVETRRELESLRSGIELQREAQEQENREVEELLQLVQREGALEQASERNRVLSQVNERLTVTLAMLLIDQDLESSQLSSSSIEQTLRQLEGRKESIRVRTAHGERNLYGHERKLLQMTQLLSGHASTEVKEGWEAMRSQLMVNVQRMVNAARIVRGESPSQDPEDQRILDTIKDYWNQIPERAQTAIKLTAAVGAGLFLLKKLFGGGRGRSRSGTLFTILGVGALIAGGVYIAGRYLKANELFDRLKDRIQGLSEIQFLEGLRAYQRGDMEGARKAWGEHSDRILTMLGGKEEEQPERIERDEEGIEWAHPREAIGHYYDHLREEMRPVTGFFQRNPEAVLMAGVVVGPRFSGLIGTGLSATKESFLAFARLSSTAVHNPLRSLFIISAFLMAREAVDDIRIPKDPDNLARYIRNRREDLSAFIRANGLGPDITEDQVDLTADMVTEPEENMGRLEEPVQHFVDDVLEGLSDRLHLSPQEKIRLESLRGMNDFINDLHIWNDEGELNAFIQTAEEITTRIRQNTENGRLTSEDVARLTREGEEQSIRITVVDDTVRYGKVNANGEYIDESLPKNLGINPSLSDEKKYEAAQHFVTNPNNRLESAIAGYSRGVLDVSREGVARMVEKYQEGGITLAFCDGKWIVIDALTQKYWDAPGALISMITSGFEENHCKEFFFEHGEGLVPVMVLGTVKNLAMLRNPLGLRALIETATYPITGIRDIGSLSWSKLVQPFRRGVASSQSTTKIGQIGDAVAEVVVRNPKIRITEHFYRMGAKLRTSLVEKPLIRRLFSIPNRQAWNQIDTLRTVLAELRHAEDWGVKMDTLERMRGLLQESDLTLELTGEVDDDLARVLRAIETKSNAVRLRSAIPEIEAVLRAGAELNGEQLATLRELARNDDTLGALKEALRRAGVADEAIDPITGVLKGDEAFESVASALRTRNIAVADDAIELASDILRSSEAAQARMATELLEEAAQSATRTQVIMGELVQGIRNGVPIEMSRISELDELLRSPKGAEEARTLLRKMGVVDDEIEAVIRGVTSAEGPESLTRTFQHAGLVERTTTAAEAVEVVTNRGTLNTALEAVRLGQDLNLEQIGALREASAADDFTDLLRSANVADDQIPEVVRLLSQEDELVRLTEGLEATEALRVGEGVKGLGRMAKFLKALPAVGLILSAGASVFESWQAFAMAEEVKNNPDLRDLLNDKGWSNAGFGVTSIAIDVGLLAGYGGYGALASTGIGVLIVFGIEAMKYMVNEALDARAETYKGYDEWTEQALSRARIEAGISLLEVDVERTYQAINNGEVLRHEELIALRKEAMDDEEDAVQGLIEQGGMSEAKARALVTALRDKDANTDEALAAAGIELTNEPRLSEAQSERIMQEARNILLHEWLVTGDDFSVGQAYDIAGNVIAGGATFGWLGHGGSEFYETHHSFTRAKLVQALVTLDSPKKPEAYLRYRIKYLQSRTTDLNVESFQQAQELLSKSKLAADVLMNRRGRTMMLGNPPESVNLASQEFDSVMITPEQVKAVFDAVSTRQEKEMKELLGEVIFDRIKGLDPNYLNYAAGALMAHISANRKNLAGNEQLRRMATIASHIGLYLQAKGYRFMPPRGGVNAEELQLVVRMFTEENLNEDQVYESLGPYQHTNRDTAALYSLARYFGYQGVPNIAMLKRFFNEEKASRQGLYWDGDDNQWVVNVEYGVDRDVEPEEGQPLYDAIIDLMRDHMNNVLGSRYNAAMDGLRSGIREDEARLQTTVQEMVYALMMGNDSVREKDIIEDTGTDVEQSPTGAFVGSMTDSAEEAVEDTQRGYESLARDPSTGLKMAGEEFVDRAETLNRETVNALDRATGGEYSKKVNDIRSRVSNTLSSARETAQEIPLIGGLFK